MSEKRPPKTIATINFKGSVGKTTVTWCLGDLISTYGDATTLLFDLDAQMSLTQAITLNEDGSLYRKFSDWSDRSQKKGKTIFRAIEEYTSGRPFDFGINYDFIYQITDKYHFVPASRTSLALAPSRPRASRRHEKAYANVFKKAFC